MLQPVECLVLASSNINETSHHRIMLIVVGLGVKQNSNKTQTRNWPDKPTKLFEWPHDTFVAKFIFNSIQKCCTPKQRKYCCSSVELFLHLFGIFCVYFHHFDASVFPCIRLSRGETTLVKLPFSSCPSSF